MNNIQSTVLALLTLTISQNVWADSLSDLQQALVMLDGNHAVSGVLSVSFSESRGEGKDKKLKTGAIKSTLSESIEGLDIRYSKDVLVQIAQENRLKMADEEADTPALNGAEILSASSLIPILSSAQTILDAISKGQFRGETQIEYFEQQVRVLDFELPLESFIDDKKTRGYVNKFKGSYKVLINDEGVPVETRLTYSGKGSAYIFFSMSAESEITSQFQIEGTRLVRINKTVESNSSSTFNDRTYSSTWKLALL
ncbi:hypothetical protein H4J38_16530 [Colwellia sp. BRX10-3]|uniref:hypothetical protein n=1 Tax=Colwellia sp. BRX10-3 TaxID=2759844 RepID=UPI0015F40B19|nr:hypothetical protein [Colwellia sp. BRX10-3]MBA6392375.1 hypothetical protein [Colwellia sp. BRX10-3]